MTTKKTDTESSIVLWMNNECLAENGIAVTGSIQLGIEPPLSGIKFNVTRSISDLEAIRRKVARLATLISGKLHSSKGTLYFSPSHLDNVQYPLKTADARLKAFRNMPIHLWVRILEEEDTDTPVLLPILVLEANKDKSEKPTLKRVATASSAPG